MIGRNIYDLRKKRGISLSELAKRSEVSKSYLSNIERSLNQNPSIQVMEKIADVLETDIKDLLKDDHEKKNEWKETEQIEQEWIAFIVELKRLGIKKEKIHEYKELIEFISWKEKRKSGWKE
jgi:XRE family transcriptional regulator, master regulator for biofilm formation